MAVTVDDVKARYADVQHVNNNVLPKYADGLGALALAKAEEDVRAILGGQGYTPSQLSSWVGYDSTVTMQALYWILATGATLDSGATGRIVKALMDTMDQRPKLEDSALFDAAGEYIVAGGAPVGFGPSKIIGPDGRGDPGEPFRDDRTGTWKRW